MIAQRHVLVTTIGLFTVAGCGGGARTDARMDADTGDAATATWDAPTEDQPDSPSLDASADDQPDSASLDASADGGPGSTDTGVLCQPGDAGADRLRSFIDLRITGVAFDEHNGSTIHLYTTPSELYGLGTQVIAGGGFVLDLPSGYKRATGSTQAIVWFVDADGDGICNSGNNDHSGYTTIGPFDPVTGADQRIDVTISDNHTNPLQGTGDPCAGATAPLLDVDISGSAFDAHEGQTIHLLTSSPYNDIIRAAGQATIQAGGFMFHFPKGLERFTYQQVFWFVDVDGDGRCTTGTDHTGYQATSAFNPSTAAPPPQRITIMDNHIMTQQSQDVCAVMNGCRPPR